MRIYKINGYVLTPDDFCSIKTLFYILANYTWGRTAHMHIKEAKLSEEDNSLNDKSDLAELEKYFPAELTVAGVTEKPRIVLKRGMIFRHFKGNRVKVLEVSQDSECTGSWIVVYESLDINAGTVWHRTADNFLGKVDREKYPDAKQEYRFELEEEP